MYAIQFLCGSHPTQWEVYRFLQSVEPLGGLFVILAAQVPGLGLRRWSHYILTVSGIPRSGGEKAHILARPEGEKYLSVSATGRNGLDFVQPQVVNTTLPQVRLSCVLLSGEEECEMRCCRVVRGAEGWEGGQRLRRLERTRRTW